MIAKSKIQFLLATLIITVAVLIAASPVYAGGWAVVTLDQLPAKMIAGQPYALGFTVRQHGQTPWKVDEIHIAAKLSQTDQAATFIAKPDGQPGHYKAELSFPQPGRWEWGIESGLYPMQQPMPAIEVAGASTVTNTQPGRNPLTTLFGAFALVAFFAGLALTALNRGKKLPSLAGAGLLVLSALLIFAFFSSANAEAGSVQAAQVVVADRDTGQKLFLAKGCVVCHVNSRAIANSEEYSVNIGPNLSTYHNDAGYLRQFLANPVGPETTFPMPNLGLSSTEIEALVSFINDSPPK